MPTLPDFRLETYFARWEFSARYHLTASDAQTLPMSRAARAGRRRRPRAVGVAGPRLHRDARAARVARRDRGDLPDAEPEDILCFAGAEEAIYLAMRTPARAVGPRRRTDAELPGGRDDPAVRVRGDRRRAAARGRLGAGRRRDRARPPAEHPDGVGQLPEQPDRRRPVARQLAPVGRSCATSAGSRSSATRCTAASSSSVPSLPQATDLSGTALSLNVMSKAYGLPGLRIGWIACRDRAVLDRLERAKHYTTICNSAPSEVLALIALRARDRSAGPQPVGSSRRTCRSSPLLREVSRALRVRPARRRLRLLSALPRCRRCRDDVRRARRTGRRTAAAVEHLQLRADRDPDRPLPGRPRPP